jgi:hypothetical protein
MKFLIYLIIAVKVIFVMFAVAYLYLNAKKDPRAPTARFWKERLEFVFIFLMSILMLNLFYPRRPQQPLNYETRLLLFLFGIILLITADWTTFFHESAALQHVQSVLSTSKRF